jgi:hypothetical protein
MMRRTLMGYFAILLMICMFSTEPPKAQERGPAPLPPLNDSSNIMASPIEMVSPGIFEIGEIRINKEKKEISFPVVVNMDTDSHILEYLLVENSGKLHESLLRTDVSPYALQVSLLLLGLEGSLNPFAEQGDPRKPEGDRVSIHVTWQAGSQTKTAMVEEWLALGKKKVKDVPWVFTGSVISNGMFLAQMEKSIIALYHDPIAILDHQLEEGASDEVWFVNVDNIPPAGTKVSLVIGKKKK